MLSLTIFQILSTGLSIVTDYTVAATGVGDGAYLPSLDAVIFALKVIRIYIRYRSQLIDVCRQTLPRRMLISRP